MLSLDELKRLYNLDYNSKYPAIKEFKQAQKYYHGHQLDAGTLNIIHSRRQTEIIENIFKMITNKIIGYKLGAISEIKVSGTQEQDKNLAFILNDILKLFSQNENYNKQIAKRDKNLLFGCAICEIFVCEDENKDFHLKLKNIDPASFCIDAYSEDLNANDSRRFHKLLNVSVAEFEHKFKVHLQANSYNDIDKRALVFESWIKEGQYFARYIWQNEGIISYEAKPYKDGKHPFIISYFDKDENGYWYGIFRDLKPLQDYINFAENRMVNMLGSFKAFFEDDAVINTDEFIQQAGLDNAVVKVRSGALRDNKIQFVQHHNNITALSNKTNEKRMIAKIISGLNDEALGIANNRMSAAAVAQRKEAGLMGLQEYLNACDTMDRLIFTRAIDLICLYFTRKQVFKMVDERVGERYFSINENGENKIRVGKFDLMYKSQIKSTANEEKMAYWAEIIKSIQSFMPDLIPALMPLMLKDTDSPVYEDIKEILAQREEALKTAAANPDENELLQKQAQLLSLEKLKAEIAEINARSKKYSSQGDLASNVALSQGIDIDKALSGVDDAKNKNQSMQKKGIDLR